MRRFPRRQPGLLRNTGCQEGHAMGQKVSKIRMPRDKRRRNDWKTLQVVLVGGGTLCRFCLRLLFEKLVDSAEVVETADIAAITDLVAQGRKIDVIVYTAVSVRDTDLSAIRELSRALPKIPIAIHTDSEDSAVLESVVAQGVTGIIPTSFCADKAVAAVQLVAAGGAYIPSTLLQGVVKNAGDVRVAGARQKKRGRLTSRETDVFELIATGLPNKEVARRLGLAESTVKIHVQSIFKKLNVRNRAELAHMAGEARAQQQAGQPAPADSAGPAGSSGKGS